jgi:hypothetical protein
MVSLFIVFLDLLLMCGLAVVIAGAAAWSLLQRYPRQTIYATLLVRQLLRW